MDYLARRLLDPALLPFVSTERLYWGYLAGALACAVVVFGWRNRSAGLSLRRLAAYCFPVRIWRHPSALLDYRFFVVNRIVFGLLVLPATTAVGLACVQGASAAMSAMLGAPSGVLPDTAAWRWIEAALAAAAMDFGLFFAHWLQHSSPLLWEFHRVHHSARVLTPITAYRMHPVDDLLSIGVSSALGGIVLGLFRYLQPDGSGPMLLLGLNALLFAYYLLGFNLRHSHVWLSYGRALSHVLVSPAQHQIHHSAAPRHFGKNLGFMLALWDWLFGTLYVPQRPEAVRFGLPEAEAREYASVRKLYFLPFARALAVGTPRALAGLSSALLLAAVFSLLVPRLAAAETDSVFVEDMTWPEVQRALAHGKTTAIYYCGSTEQNGPHMAIGKHNFIARHVAGSIARQLGNALVYPIMPFAPTGDIASRTGHMRFPGSVSVPDDTFAAVARSVAESAIAAGFRRVALMGDHGGGQQALERVARELDRKWAPKGVRVGYIGDLYFKTQEETGAQGTHAALEDTSELMSLDPEGRWIRRDQLAAASAANGVQGDPRAASAEAGRRYLALKISNAVAQIRNLSR